MEKYKKIVIVLIVYILIISGFIFIKTWKRSYTKANYNAATVQEKEKLDFFYNGSIPISKGKYFDMRYLYYDGKSPTKIEFEVVKKVEEDIKIEEIIIYNGQGELIMRMENNFLLDIEFQKMQAGAANIIGTYKNYRYYGISISEYLFRMGEQYLTPDEEYRNLQKFTIELKIDGAIEKHELVFDRKESLNTLKQVNAWNHVEKQEMRGGYLSYYYGLLVKENFEQWKQEVELLLNDNNAKDYFWSNIFNLPSTFVGKYSIQHLQSYLNLSNEEFESYLMYLKKAMGKGLIDKSNLDQMIYN